MSVTISRTTYALLLILLANSIFIWGSHVQIGHGEMGILWSITKMVASLIAGFFALVCGFVQLFCWFIAWRRGE